MSRTTRTLSRLVGLVATEHREPLPAGQPVNRAHRRALARSKDAASRDLLIRSGHLQPRKGGTNA